MGGRFGQGFVVHLNGLNLSGQLVSREGDNHTGFDDTSFDNGGIFRFDRFGIGFSGLSGTTIDLFLNLVEFASDVSSVAI